MTLRCRPGDLAIVVRAKPARTWGIGRIVRVIELAPPGTFAEGPAWRTADRIYGPAGDSYGHVLDACLRPIRPDADPVDVEHREPTEALA